MNEKIKIPDDSQPGVPATEKTKNPVTFEPNLLGEVVAQLVQEATKKGKRIGELELLQGVRAAHGMGNLDNILTA